MTPSFFVVGLPRSGTTWLSRLFASMNPSTIVVHEGYRADFGADAACALQPGRADGYVADFRRGAIEKRINGNGKATAYGEITPRMRYWSAAMQREYPDAVFVHLVRDPRATVVSMMNYGYYATHGRRHRRIAPDGGKWSRVKRTAWAYAFGHSRIRSHVHEFFRLEDLLSDFGEIERLAEMIGQSCDREVWARRREKKVNVSNRTTPEYEKWPPSWRAEFWSMCEEEATCYGYKADG